MTVIKILLFLMVNIAGFFTSAFLINIAVMLDLYPQMPTKASLYMLNDWLYLGSFWIWLVGMLLSVAYFVVEKNQAWFIMAPLYMPTIYTISVILYFTYAPITI